VIERNRYGDIATRYAKRARNFKAFLYIAATVIWMA